MSSLLLPSQEQRVSLVSAVHCKDLHLLTCLDLYFIGQVIVEVVATEFGSQFSRVIALSRTSTSPVAVKLANLGVELRKIPDDLNSEGLVRAFKGIDVFVNALGSTDLKTKNELAQAAVKAGVTVYFPSEFGM